MIARWQMQGNTDIAKYSGAMPDQLLLFKARGNTADIQLYGYDFGVAI